MGQKIKKLWQVGCNFTRQSRGVEILAPQQPMKSVRAIRSEPSLVFELDFGQGGIKAIRRAFKSQGYERRISKRKCFSDTPEHRQNRLKFALAAIQWTPKRLSR